MLETPDDDTRRDSLLLRELQDGIASVDAELNEPPPVRARHEAVRRPGVRFGFHVVPAVVASVDEDVLLAVQHDVSASWNRLNQR